jgi:MarR family transcriptional regulator, temperature-dependent positive regulator of motility
MHSNAQSRSPVHLLHRVLQGADDRFSRNVDGVTPSQLAVLIAIDQNEGASQMLLSAFTGIDRATITDIVVRLRSKGLVLRWRNSKDIRAYAVALTNEGRDVLRMAERQARKVDSLLLEALPACRRDPFLAKLSLVVERLGAEQKV